MNEIAKKIIWIGDSLYKIQQFPREVKKDIGVSLYVAQLGERPHGTKVLRGMGKGVIEIISPFDTNTYRVIYAVKIGTELFVLDAFQKKSKS